MKLSKHKAFGNILGMFGVPERCGKLKVDLRKFDAGFFGIPPKLAPYVETGLRQILHCVHEAIVDAGMQVNFLEL